MGDEPLEEELHKISWKELLFTKATVEYKNLSFWGSERHLKSNLSELRLANRTNEEKQDLILKTELSLAEKKEQISDTLVYRNYGHTNLEAFQNGIQGYIGVKLESFIDFDFGKENACLEVILNQVGFLQQLLHFAMLPHRSTYILSMSVEDEKGDRYQLLLSGQLFPKRNVSSFPDGILFRSSIWVR